VGSVTTKLEYQVKEHMQNLGIYKPEFDITIKIYCGLVDQYEQLEKQFKKSKFTVVEETGYADNKKKHPLVGSMESLRKDILVYATALGLTPQGLKKLTKDQKPKPKQSKLEQALNNFGT
jgi:P27 family predicted phage terminase small subunit